jgi:tRNA (cytidine/uridine-2'-O-)-methyltransferase
VGFPQSWCVETPNDKPYTQADFADGDCLLFGSESSGLPMSIRQRFAERLIGIPMPGSGAVRSLNLATAVGIVLYDALRRLHGW